MRKELDKAWGVPADDEAPETSDPESWGTSEAAQRDNMKAMQIADGVA